MSSCVVVALRRRSGAASLPRRARQAAPRCRRCWRGALGRVAAGAEQSPGLQPVVSAAAAVTAAAVIKGSVGAGVLQAEEHAPPSRRVARMGDEVRVAGQPAPAASVPALTNEQARPFHVHPPVACQHGSPPLSRAHKKGAARPWNMSTDAPRPDGE